MGYRYHTQLRFPRFANEIPEIKKWLENTNLDVIELGRIIEITDYEANYGEIGIGALLEDMGIPFDHEHNDSNSCTSWTVFMRFDIEGMPVRIVKSAFDFAQSSWAVGILEQLDAGVSTKVREALQAVADREVQELESLA